jgi:hypothetical protein
MGVWSLPDTEAKREQIRDLLTLPIRADEAHEKLYNLLGCDSFFDALDETLKKDGPDADVRVLLEIYLEKYNIDIDETKSNLSF